MSFSFAAFVLLASAATPDVQAQVPTTPPPMTMPAAPAQTPQAQSSVNGLEIAAVAHGWMLLSQGLFAQADARASELIQSFPRSQSVLALALEARLASQGSAAALDQYEAWLGDRTLEEPSALRRIALGVLREQAKSSEDGDARVEAARGLRDEGQAPAADVGSLDRSGIRAQAAAGQATAVAALVKELDAGTIDGPTGIQILGDSGSPAAIKPLLARLKDPRPELRGSAADAIGRIPASAANKDVVAALNALLSDETSFVRIKAAGALYRMGNDSGAQMIRDLASSDSAQTRLVAAEALSSRPDAAAIDLLRGLVQADQPEVRARAAQLLAPHDPALARRTLDQLASDPNPVIREMALRAQPAASGQDLPALRRMLRSPDRLTRVRTASQIVALTR